MFQLNKKNLIFVAILLLFVARPAAAGLLDIETAIIKEDYELSKKLAEEFLLETNADDQIYEANYYLALSYLMLDDYQKARELFKQLVVIKKYEKFKDKAYLGLYNSYFLEEDYKHALKTAQKLLKTNPDSSSLSLIYLKIARAHLKLTHWSEARDYLKKIIAKFPESLEAHAARQLLEEKQYFSVQVGAFIEQHRAEKLMNELAESGEYAYIVETMDQKNTKFYRVRVGQIAKLDEAFELKTRLSKSGYPAQIYP